MSDKSLVLYGNPLRFIPGPCSHCGVCAPLRTPQGERPSWDGICEPCDEALFRLYSRGLGEWVSWEKQAKRLAHARRQAALGEATVLRQARIAQAERYMARAG